MPSQMKKGFVEHVYVGTLTYAQDRREVFRANYIGDKGKGRLQSDGIPSTTMTNTYKKFTKDVATLFLF